jgi:hypothetical protein
MLKRIQNFLNQPYPYEYNLRTIFGESAGIGVFIFRSVENFAA